MKINLGFYIITALIVTTYSCKKSPSKFDEGIPKINEINSLRLDTSIIKIVSLIPDTFTTETSWIKFYYKNNRYKPQWVYSSKLRLKTDTLLAFLSKSEEHGIDIQHFDLDTINFLNNKLKKFDLPYSNIAYLDIKLAIAYLKYCRALKYGMFQPEKISPNYYYKTLAIDSAFVWDCFKNKDRNLHSFLTSLQPTDKNYKKLQWERKVYLQLKDSTFASIPELPEKKTIELGESHAYIPLIIRRLNIGKKVVNVKLKPLTDSVFDQHLLTSLNVFRQKTGIFIDEEIGNKTIRTLNIPFKNYVEKIDVNLERLRWKPSKELRNKYIKVNVANMTLQAFNDDTLALKMKVCVGKFKNKTPFLRSNIFEIILNPTWTIPKSIVVKETSISASSDTNYLKRNRIKVFRKGQLVQASNIDWTQISENHQPYKLIQDPGSFNSLGRIKFNFSNKFNVYLHDTNTKSAFRRHNRAVSHGCVRVEKPLDLSFFCLQEYDRKVEEKVEERQVLQDKIRNSIGLKVISQKGIEMLKDDTQNMKLKVLNTHPGIPVLIEYFTCFVNDEGEVVFQDDIYELDNFIANNLKNIKHFKVHDLNIEHK